MYHRTCPGMPPDPSEGWVYVAYEPQRWHGWKDLRRGFYATRAEAEAARAKEAEDCPWRYFGELQRIKLSRPKGAK